MEQADGAAAIEAEPSESLPSVVARAPAGGSPPITPSKASASAWKDVEWNPEPPPAWPPVEILAPEKLPPPTLRASSPPSIATPPAAPPGSSGSTTARGWPEALDDYDQEGLCALLQSKGDVPADLLGMVCSRIEQFSVSKAPKQIAQRRVFVSDWLNKHGAATPRGAGAGAGGEAGWQGTAAGLGGLARSVEREAPTEAELAANIGALVDGNGYLRLPPEAVPRLTAEVTNVLGLQKSPPSLSARRRLIEDWYAAAVERLTPRSLGPALSAADGTALRAAPPGGWTETSQLRFCDPAATSPLGSPPLTSPVQSQGSPGARVDAYRAAAARASSDLCAELAAAELVPQLLPTPSLGGARLRSAASQIVELTGARPAGETAAELQSFVGDWFRWQQHLSASPPLPTEATPDVAAPSLPSLRQAMPSSPHRPAAPPPAVTPPSRDSATSEADASDLTEEQASLRPAARPPVPRTGGRGSGFGSGCEEASDAPMWVGSLSLTRARAADSRLPVLQVLAELAAGAAAAGLGTPTSASLAALDASDLQVSTSRLSGLSKNIQLLSGKRVPPLPKQKRDFVLQWWKQALQRREHAEASHVTSPRAPAPRVDSNPIRTHEGQRANSSVRSALHGLLSGFPPSAGGSELDVPLEHLEIVTKQVEQLTGRRAPRQPHARRQFLADVCTVYAVAPTPTAAPFSPARGGPSFARRLPSMDIS